MAMEAVLGSGDKVELSSSERIVEAAAQCIEKFGAKRCTMDDIAKAAGLTRKTVYRAYANRQELLDKVATRQYTKLIACLAKHCSEAMTLPELVESGILIATDWIKADAILQSLLENSDHLSFSHYLMAPDSQFQDLTVAFFASFLDMARNTGQLRENLDNQKFVAWVRSGQLLIMLRPELSREEQRDFIHEFILPALIRQP